MLKSVRLVFVNSIRHLMHWRLMPFWQTWCILTAEVGICTALLFRPSVYRTVDQQNAGRLDWSRRTVVPLILLALLLGVYTVVVLVWEDFTWYDNSQFTALTLRGVDFPPPVWPASGRFFPLGLQEFNVIRHFTRTVTGYHSFPILELLILASLLLLLDERLSIASRVVLAAVVLLTPSIVVSFTGLIYTERNLVLLLVCFALLVKKFEKSHSAGWAIAAVLCAQVMLYLKEPVFLLLLSFAAARLILRTRNIGAGGWSFDRLRDAESRLDCCIAAAAVLFLAYYIIAMFPHTGALSMVRRDAPMLETVRFYLDLDLLAWVFAAVLVIRLYRIVRGEVAALLLWDGLACGGLVYFAAYLVLRIKTYYYLAPVDLIAVLYLGHLLFLSWAEIPLRLRVAAATLATVILYQNLDLSAYQTLARKYFVQRVATTASLILARYERGPELVEKLYFPFTSAYMLGEFASYLSYRGLPVEEAGSQSKGGGRVEIFGGGIATNGRCVVYRDFVCHPGAAAGPSTLIVVLPNDPVLPAQQYLYTEWEAKLQSYDSRVHVPDLLIRASRFPWREK